MDQIDKADRINNIDKKNKIDNIDKICRTERMDRMDRQMQLHNYVGCHIHWAALPAKMQAATFYTTGRYL